MWKIGSSVILVVALLSGCTPAQVVQGNGPRGTQVPTASQIAVGVPPSPTTLVYPLNATFRNRSGTSGAQSYGWLENTGSQMTRHWLEEESRLTRPHLEALPQRAWVQQRLTQLDRLADRLDASRGAPSPIPAEQKTEDGHYLVISLSDGNGHNGVSVLDLFNPRAKARSLFEVRDNWYRFIGSNGAELYFVTNRDAPLGRVIAVITSELAPAKWTTVVPENDVALLDAHYVGGRFVAHYVRGAHSAMRVYEKDGRPVGEVPLPGLGTVEGFEGKGKERESFFSYSDYLTPPQVYRYDVPTNTISVWRKSSTDLSTAAYVTEEVSYLGVDGTRLPMLITHRRDMARDGNQSVLLYAGGAADGSFTPRFKPAVIVWLELGGVYAEARQSGTDDLIAAAGFLISSRYTRPQKLGLLGSGTGDDAGGSLAGTVLTQRPDLFGVVLPVAGALDKVKKGTCYPPTLVTSGDSEPWRSYQFAAALQDAQGCPNPILIRVGAGEIADPWAFAAQSLKLSVPQ
jgi:prolyl oligopeptidase PreP (S9A serine peptidase family)